MPLSERVGDTWHLTYDLWHLVGGGGGVSILTKFQLPSFSGLSVVMFLGFGGKGSVNQSMHSSPTPLNQIPKEEEKNLYVFFLNRCYYPHTERDLLSPMCGIFFSRPVTEAFLFLIANIEFFCLFFSSDVMPRAGLDPKDLWLQY